MNGMGSEANLAFSFRIEASAPPQVHSKFLPLCISPPKFQCCSRFMLWVQNGVVVNLGKSSHRLKYFEKARHRPVIDQVVRCVGGRNTQRRQERMSREDQ
jgi:hypothetical protein